MYVSTENTNYHMYYQCMYVQKTQIINICIYTELNACTYTENMLYNIDVCVCTTTLMYGVCSKLTVLMYGVCNKHTILVFAVSLLYWCMMFAVSIQYLCMVFTVSKQYWCMFLQYMYAFAVSVQATFTNTVSQHGVQSLQVDISVNTHYHFRYVQCVSLLFIYAQCEGKPYSYKSDIWALGCILYEMATLQKTFEGSNLPALVNKIMKVNYLL